MDEDDKVISLAERLARKGEAGQEEAPAEDEPPGEPLPARLIWLHCPTCGTTEYTELDLPGGRRHNACGTVVEEAVVEVDVRAELTIASINLERLEAIETAVAAQRAHYEEYRNRLHLLAGAEPRPYPLTPEALRRLPVAEVDALGLLVPDALHRPMRRFAAEQPATGEGAEPPSDPEPRKP